MTNYMIYNIDINQTLVIGLVSSYSPNSSQLVHVDLNSFHWQHSSSDGEDPALNI